MQRTPKIRDCRQNQFWEEILHIAITMVEKVNMKNVLTPKEQPAFDKKYYEIKNTFFGDKF